MKAVISVGLLLVIWALPAVSAQTGETTQSATPPLKPVDLVITHKEVLAVQAALLGRGYYSSRPNGVLDAETRQALRTYQANQQLEVTGKIDRATLASLEINYPVTGEAAGGRHTGLLPKIGYTAKDGAVTTKNTVTSAVRKTGSSVKGGYEYSKDRAVGAVNYSKEKTVGAYNYSKDKTVGTITRGKDVSTNVGDSAAGGVKTVSRKTTDLAKRTSTAIVGRNDLDIHTEVREVLDTDPQTRQFTTSVKNGSVTVKLPPGYKSDYGGVIASIRRINGVQSVFVVQP